MPKISQLPSDTPQTGDYYPALQASTSSTKRFSLANLINLIFNNIPSSVVKNANLSTATGELGGYWQTFTPSWTNFTPGNGIVVATYTQIGKTIFFEVVVTFGSTTSVNGGVLMTLPMESNVTSYPIGVSIDNIIGVGMARITNAYQLYPSIDSTSGQSSVRILAGSTSAGQYESLSSSAPNTWTSSSAFQITGSYQIN